MTNIAYFTKDPSAILDYQLDWSEWLGSDTIASHTVTAATGLTVVSSTATTSAVTMWLSGGTAGTSYVVTCRVVTAGGRTDERSITFDVVDR